MEIIGSAAFGMDLNSQTNPNEPFLQKAKDMLEIFENKSIIRAAAGKGVIDYRGESSSGQLKVRLSLITERGLHQDSCT